MNEKDLDRLHGLDFRTGQIRSMKEGTPHYRKQPYMEFLVVVQKVIEDFGLNVVNEVKHADSCAGKKNWGKSFCDCQPDFILHFLNGQTYRYRSAEEDAERFLRSWLTQNKGSLQ